MSEELQRAIKRAERERLENTLLFQLKAAGLPEPIREAKLVEGRKWRYDFFFESARLVIEVEGGVFTGGRHLRPLAFEADIQKYNAITLLGYTLLRYSGRMVENGEALAGIQAALALKGEG